MLLCVGVCGIGRVCLSCVREIMSYLYLLSTVTPEFTFVRLQARGHEIGRMLCVGSYVGVVLIYLSCVWMINSYLFIFSHGTPEITFVWWSQNEVVEGARLCISNTCTAALKPLSLSFLQVSVPEDPPAVRGLRPKRRRGNEYACLCVGSLLDEQ